MDYRKKIEQHLAKTGGIITASYCRANDIPTVYLTRLVREGLLTRESAGLYISKNGMYDEYYFLQHRFSKVVFSYETALHLLGVTDKIPQTIDITVHYSYKFNETPPGVNIHYVHKGLHDLGMVEVRTMFNNKVKVYSYERTLCDFIAHKDKMDAEVYITLIRSYAKYEEKDIQALYNIAVKMGIEEDVKSIMELVYE